jgi:hypothetical protein
MRYFSEDSQTIGAECPECGRVISVRKERLKENEGRFISEPAIICICKAQYTEIDMSNQKRNITADLDLPSCVSIPTQVATRI